MQMEETWFVAVIYDRTGIKTKMVKKNVVR